MEPEQEGGQRITYFITYFILLTRGIRNSAKKRIIDTCLMFVAQNLRTKVTEDNGFDWSAFWLDKSLFTVEYAKSCN